MVLFPHLRYQRNGKTSIKEKTKNLSALSKFAQLNFSGIENIRQPGAAQVSASYKPPIIIS